MANPLYKQVGTMKSPINIPAFMQEVRKVQQTMTGDPRAMVQQLLNSGQMSQEQFNQFAQIANQIIGGKM